MQSKPNFTHLLRIWNSRYEVLTPLLPCHFLRKPYLCATQIHIPMKQLNVPHIPGLDSLDLSSVASVLEVKGTRAYIDSLNWPTAFPYQPIAAFDIARSDDELFLHFFARGFSLRAEADCDGTPVYPDSCVEFFVQEAGAETYLNFEFNCIGTCEAGRRRSRTEVEPLSAEEYASIRRYTQLPRRRFSEQGGIHAWELTVAIPFRLMGLDAAELPDSLRANFYKCADGTRFPHYLSWNPIDLPEPNFHCPQFFGEIIFEK